jgi:hypothetical protein
MLHKVCQLYSCFLLSGILYQSVNILIKLEDLEIQIKMLKYKCQEEYYYFVIINLEFK